MTYYVIDAFTDSVFGGNPAGVLLSDEALDSELMQRIAAENNLSETAFPIRRDGYYDLRWFTPACEVDLCGHATLASSYVIFNHVEPDAKELRFLTKSGYLYVRRDGDLYVMDFPAVRIKHTKYRQVMEEAIGVYINDSYITESGSDLILVVEDTADIMKARPDFGLIKELAPHAVTITAKGDGRTYDFVSRFFGPNVGVPEDPVTGSAHTKLIPYWAERLGKNKLIARQASKRGGTLYCENCGERVRIGGKAVQYLKGEIQM